MAPVQHRNRTYQCQLPSHFRAYQARYIFCARRGSNAWAYLTLLVLCLCAFGLSSCGQNTGQQSAQSRQQQRQSTTQTYVAIGASDTFGIGASDPYTQNWPTDLTALLKQPVHLVNLGVPSMTLHAALTAELPVALDAHPGLVTIWLAVNDLADNVRLSSYSHDLDTMLSRLYTVAPHARIAVGNVPDLTSVPFFSSYNQAQLNQQIANYNTVITSVVQRHHAILVDLSGQGYNLQEFPEYISGDGLHPSDAGYLRLAQLFYDALQKA